MKLDYIYHSGFAIEADGVTVIIDYYKDSSETEYNKGIVHDYLLGRPGELYVLSSHFHPDHFNREVLLWKAERPDIHYIFSKDILKHRRATREDATYINKGDVYEDPNIRIEAFGSTDVGNVTHAMPAAQFYIGVGEGLGTHTAPFAEASGGPAGKRALLAAVKVLAMTGLDMMAE